MKAAGLAFGAPLTTMTPAQRTRQRERCSCIERFIPVIVDFMSEHVRSGTVLVLLLMQAITWFVLAEFLPELSGGLFDSIRPCVTVLSWDEVENGTPSGSSAITQEDVDKVMRLAEPARWSFVVYVVLGLLALSRRCHALFLPLASLAGLITFSLQAALDASYCGQLIARNNAYIPELGQMTHVSAAYNIMHDVVEVLVSVCFGWMAVQAACDARRGTTTSYYSISASGSGSGSGSGLYGRLHSVIKRNIFAVPLRHTVACAITLVAMVVLTLQSTGLVTVAQGDLTQAMAQFDPTDEFDSTILSIGDFAKDVLTYAHAGFWVIFSLQMALMCYSFLAISRHYNALTAALGDPAAPGAGGSGGGSGAVRKSSYSDAYTAYQSEDVHGSGMGSGGGSGSSAESLPLAAADHLADMSDSASSGAAKGSGRFDPETHVPISAGDTDSASAEASASASAAGGASAPLPLNVHAFSYFSATQYVSAHVAANLLALCVLSFLVSVIGVLVRTVLPLEILVVLFTSLAYDLAVTLGKTVLRFALEKVCVLYIWPWLWPLVEPVLGPCYTGCIGAWQCLGDCVTLRWIALEDGPYVLAPKLLMLGDAVISMTVGAVFGIANAGWRMLFSILWGFFKCALLYEPVLPQPLWSMDQPFQAYGGMMKMRFAKVLDPEAGLP